MLTEIKEKKDLERNCVSILKSPSVIKSRKWEICMGGVAEVVEHLLCGHQAMSWNSSPTKKKKKKIFALQTKYMENLF
jgi:hypothetical protein